LSLRSRLTLFFVVIVVVPVAAMTLWQWRVATVTAVRYEREALAVDGHAAGLVLRAQGRHASEAARLLAGSPEVQAALVRPDRRALQGVLDRGEFADLLVAVTGAHGELLAHRGRTEPRLLGGVPAPRLEALVGAGPNGPDSGLLQRQSVPVERRDCGDDRCLLGTVVAGVWLDDLELDRLRPDRSQGADLTFVVGGRPVASTLTWMTGRDQVPVADQPRSDQPRSDWLSDQPRSDQPRSDRLAGRRVLAATGWLSATPGQEARLVVTAFDRTAAGAVDPRLAALFLLLMVAAGLIATLLGAVLARLLSQPLRELADQARAIAKGDFASPPSAVRSGGEVGELARAFDSMRVELGEYLAALRDSRDELSRSMTRLGQTLSSTHDLPKLLEVVLEAAVRTCQARAGSVLLLTTDRTALVRQATFGLADRELAARIAVGQGVAGSVAATGKPMVAAAPLATVPGAAVEPGVRPPGSRPPQPAPGMPPPGSRPPRAAPGARPSQVPPARAPQVPPARGRQADAAPGNLDRSAVEPPASSQVSVPLLSQGRVLGVLNVYDRESGEPFALADARALADFAFQAAVAIENVRLHEEAERLSLTDAVTGTWNYRYFERRFEQELERSRRFDRLFALLMLDVDHFKVVNDRHGHQRGDEVLMELARRILSSVRDIDTFARYGGEEFVLILPETNLAGGIATAEKLRDLVNARPFTERPGDGGVRLTLSIGVACYPEHARSTSDLLRAADDAMYEAKHRGRDRVVVAGPVPASAPTRSRSAPTRLA
jgi:diguanylate cyclase (GGDEF)-like protein